MFDSILLRKAATDDVTLSAGQLAEALLYYQRIYLFLQRGTLDGLVQQLGADTLLRVLRRPEVSATYVHEFVGVMTDQRFGLQYHQLDTLSIMESEKGEKLNNTEARLNYDLRNLGMSRKEAKGFIKSFLDLVKVRSLSGDAFIDGGVLKAANSELADAEFIKKAARQVMLSTPDAYDPGDNLTFETHATPDGVVVFTDIDFDRVNRLRPPGSVQFTQAWMLSNIYNASTDMLLAGHYGSDLATTDMASRIIRSRHQTLMRRTIANKNEQRKFHREIVLPDSPRLAEVIDSGERSFDEFLRLLDRASRFKDWLKSASPDEGIIREYQAAMSNEGWMNGLPAKIVRFFAMQGIDALTTGYPVVSKAVGAIDTFLVDKLLKGWRPNQFVDKGLRPFVDPENPR